MPSLKGKQDTKGAKQIVEENTSTLNFYKCMGAYAMCAYIVITLVFFSDTFSLTIIFLYILTSTSFIICLTILRKAATAKISETGQILDSGLDINMEGGFSEQLKDMIILSSGTQILSLFSNYFWFLLLLVPARASYILWKSILEDVESDIPQVSEKKQKKLERKMKMHQN